MSKTNNGRPPNPNRQPSRNRSQGNPAQRRPDSSLPRRPASASRNRSVPASEWTTPPAANRQEARKAQIARRKRRRRRRLMAFYSLLLLLVLTVAAALSLTVFFHIESIEVKGNDRYQTEAVLAACGVQLQDNLFLTNLNKTEEALEKNLPYIYQAKVRRELPDRLTIQVTEANAFYGVQQGKSYLLMDDQGKVLESSVAKMPDHSVLLNGVQVKSGKPGEPASFQKEKTGEVLTALKEAVKASKITGITEMNLKSLSNIILLYDGRIKLELGTNSDLEYKLTFGKEALTKLEETNPGAKGTLNLTIPKRAYFEQE